MTIKIRDSVFRPSKKKPRSFFAFIKTLEVHLSLTGYISKTDMCDELNNVDQLFKKINVKITTDISLPS